MEIRGTVLPKYGSIAASTRQRFLQFIDDLSSKGIHIDVFPLLKNEYIEAMISGCNYNKIEVVRSYISRIRNISRGCNSKFLWIQFDALPFTPAYIESALYPPSVPRIYDFDDAIFHQYETHPNPLMRRLIGRKFETLLKGADLAICGNAYLQAYALRFCKEAVIVPTVVDTEIFVPRAWRPKDDPVTIGWIGSPSTWKYVRPIIPVLEELARTRDVRVRIVGAGRQTAPTPYGFEFQGWSESDEIATLQGMDIGIMPLPDEPWARGKCGYKLIQYMACGVPTVASPVGVNREIVEDGITGFHATDTAEWMCALTRLVNSSENRNAMGSAGRLRAVAAYSRQRHGPRLAELIHGVADRSRP